MARFQISHPLLQTVYGAGIPNRRRFLCLSGAIPFVRVSKRAFSYQTQTADNMTPSSAKDYARAPGTTFKQGSLSSSEESGVTVEYGEEYPIDREEAANADFDVRRQKFARKGFFQMVGVCEQLLANFFAASGNFSASNAATSLTGQWSDDSSRPFEDVAAQVRAIYDAIGGAIGRIIMAIDEETLHALIEHARVRDAVKYVSGQPGLPELVSYFSKAGVDDIILKRSIKNTAGEGEDFAGGRYFTDNVEIFFVSDDADTTEADGSWMKVFMRDSANLTDSYNVENAPVVRIEEGYREEIDADVVRARTEFVLKLTNSSAARRITDVVA